MSIEEAARATVQYFPRFEEAVVMTAIIGGESAYHTGAEGDAAEGPLARYAPMACNGKLSFGYGQVFLGVWSSKVAELSGFAVTDPCSLATWLKDPMNNLRMCRHIFEVQGFGAWSAFNAGTYQQFLDSANVAVGEAMHGPQPRGALVTSVNIAGKQIRIQLSDGSAVTYAFE